MCSVSWFPFLCQVHWFVFLYNLIYVWSCECIFNFSYYIFTSAWFFIIFSNSVKFLTMFIHSFPKFSESLYNHVLKSLFCRLLISTSFSSFSEVMFDFCLKCIPLFPHIPQFVYSNVLSRSVTFPNLGEVDLCRSCSMTPSNISSLTRRSTCSRSAPSVCCVSLLLWWGWLLRAH